MSATSANTSRPDGLSCRWSGGRGIRTHEDGDTALAVFKIAGMLAGPSRSLGTDPVHLTLNGGDKCCQTLEAFAQARPAFCLVKADLCERWVYGVQIPSAPLLAGPPA
jgi:hypothetical protein